MIQPAGETEAGAAGEQLARDSRLGVAPEGGKGDSPRGLVICPYLAFWRIPLCLRKLWLGAGKPLSQTQVGFSEFTLTQWIGASS